MPVIGVVTRVGLIRRVIMLVKEAKEYGSISKGNTKMPGTTYAVDSFACHVGEMLSKKAGSICEQCNMRRLQKIRPLVDKGYKINLEKWQRSIGSIIKWVDAMVFQIKRYCSDGHHRWFDGGDLQSYEMLMAIDSVATRAAGYGMPGVAVDGTDVSAVYDATWEAACRARVGQGPTFIEAMVERCLPHTSDDDDRRYRSLEEIEEAKRKERKVLRHGHMRII